MSECVVPIETEIEIYANLLPEGFSAALANVHRWRPRWAGWSQGDPGLILALGLFYVGWDFSRSTVQEHELKPGGYNCPQ